MCKEKSIKELADRIEMLESLVSVTLRLGAEVIFHLTEDDDRHVKMYNDIMQRLDNNLRKALNDNAARHEKD